VDLTVTLLEWLMANGPLTLGFVAMICALGVPLPVPVLMIAAGALVRQGHMHLPTVIAFTAGGALVAELFYYGLGRKLGPLARTRAGVRFAAVYDAAELRFNQQPGLSVYLTRWLLAPIGIPTSLVAGASRFSPARFVAAAVLGNAMWITGYVAGGTSAPCSTGTRFILRRLPWRWGWRSSPGRNGRRFGPSCAGRTPRSLRP
jgi:membrane protein DedA with SNARE-associated domain